MKDEYNVFFNDKYGISYFYKLGEISYVNASYMFDFNQIISFIFDNTVIVNDKLRLKYKDVEITSIKLAKTNITTVSEKNETNNTISNITSNCHDFNLDENMSNISIYTDVIKTHIDVKTTLLNLSHLIYVIKLYEKISNWSKVNKYSRKLMSLLIFKHDLSKYKYIGMINKYIDGEIKSPSISYIFTDNCVGTDIEHLPRQGCFALFRDDNDVILFKLYNTIDSKFMELKL